MMRNSHSFLGEDMNGKPMKSRLLSVFMIFCMVCSFSGCGQDASDQNNNVNESVSDIISQASENLAVTDEVLDESESLSDLETEKSVSNDKTTKKKAKQGIDSKHIPKFDDEPYMIVNHNEPDFSKREITEVSFERYSQLDRFGRCGVALACVGTDMMPTEKRGSIGMVKPTGWHTVKYEFVDGKYLYNRCHLIGYQLTGENANEKNLITGTRYMNVDGMLPFEDMVADYVKETKNHVMYRVTPVYKENNLLASGVQMEGYSVEDKGKGISFNVYCYNVQPGVKIDYKTGESSTNGKLVEETTKKKNVAKKDNSSSSSGSTQYILNMNTHKFHDPDCGSVKIMSESNKGTYTGSREDLIEQGYEPCGNCNP